MTVTGTGLEFPDATTQVSAGAAVLGLTNQASTQSLQRTGVTFNGLVLSGTSREYCFGADYTTWITLLSQPTAGDTVTIAGTAGTSTTVTFVASGATGNQVNIGATSYATALALYTMLNASTDTNLYTNTYSILNGNQIVIKPNTGNTNPAVSASVPAEWSYYYPTYADCASQRLARYIGADPSNTLLVAAPGNQACNFLQHQILPNYPGPGAVASWPLAAFGGPINDVTFGGGSPPGQPGPTTPPFPYLPDFSTCEKSAWTWQGVPATLKVFGSSFSQSGGTCTTDTTFPNVPGLTCTTAGTTITSPSITTTQAGPVYAWIEAVDGDAGAGTITIGSQTLPWTTALPEPLITNNGLSSGVQLIRFASVPAGTFTVSANVTTSGTVGLDLLAVGTPPIGGITTKPVVLVNDIASQPSNGNAIAVAAYNVQLYADFAQILGDGVGLVLAPESQHVIWTPSAGAFQGSNDHENIRIGQKMMYEADLDGLQGLPLITGRATSLDYPCVQASSGTTYLNPGDSCVWISGPATIVLPYYPSASGPTHPSINSQVITIIDRYIYGASTIQGVALGDCPTTMTGPSYAICVGYGAGYWANILAPSSTNTLTLTGTANATINNAGSGTMIFNVPSGQYYQFDVGSANIATLQAGYGFGSIPATAATSSANVSGTYFSGCGNYWTGSASAPECSYLQTLFPVGSGTPTYSFSKFLYSGSIPTLYSFGYSPVQLGMEPSTTSTVPYNVNGASWYGTDVLAPVWYNGSAVKTTASTSQLPLTGTTGSIGGSALVAGACTSGTVAVAGSTTAMAVPTSPAIYPGDGMFWHAYVSTAGTVTVKVCASIAGTPTASTYNVRVIQ